MHIPDSYWLRHMIEGLIMQVEKAAPSGLLSQDIISSANAIQAYLEEYDKLRSLEHIQHAVPLAPQRLGEPSTPPLAPHGHHASDEA